MDLTFTDGSPDALLDAVREGGFGVAVYETMGDANCVAFCHSDDPHRWARTSHADNLYECPDLFPLTPAGGGPARWVLYGGDGMVRVGEFSGGAARSKGRESCRSAC